MPTTAKAPPYLGNKMSCTVVSECTTRFSVNVKKQTLIKGNALKQYQTCRIHVILNRFRVEYCGLKHTGTFGFFWVSFFKNRATSKVKTTPLLPGTKSWRPCLSTATISKTFCCYEIFKKGSVAPEATLFFLNDLLNDTYYRTVN